MSELPILIPDHTSDSDVRDAVVTWKRFAKAQKLADILDGEGITVEDSKLLDTEMWLMVLALAQVKRASVVTRLLALELLRDREERKHRG
jgi:hypothetical protein